MGVVKSDDDARTARRKSEKEFSEWLESIGWVNFETGEEWKPPRRLPKDTEEDYD